LQSFTDSLLHTRCGVAELVIPPDSALIGKSIRGLRMRETYQLTVLAVYRAGQTLREDLPNIPFQAGDTLVCHTAWDALARLEKNRDFVVVTSEYPHEEERPHKLVSALGFFLLSLALVLLSDMRLGAAMLIGAIGMVVSGVLSMDEAYASVSWKTIFLLAGLMPLGLAVQHSGTADWIAQLTLAIFAHVPEWVLQVVLALMASAFSLVMSNVGATILLVPVAVSIAVSAGADPTLYALIVALGTSNCFLIPTNQVNALIMGPGGYSNADFFRVGGIMTILFLIVSLLVLNAVF
jgi:di/tricarboxylate transporter